MSLEVRTLATAGLLAATVLGASAASASADTQATLKWTCKYPLVDKNPLDIDVTSNIPASASIGQPIGPLEFRIVARTGGATSDAVDVIEAYKLTGKMSALFGLHLPSGDVQNLPPLTLPLTPWERPQLGPVPASIPLAAAVSTPAITLNELGRTYVQLDRFNLNLTASRADGTPINVKKLSTGFGGEVVTDSDGNPDTFDVYCRINVGESSSIASIDVISDGGIPPARVTGLKATSITDTTAAFSWDFPIDADALPPRFNLYLDGAKVGTYTDKSATLTGLLPSRTYVLTVEPVNGDGTVGLSSELTFKTAPAPIVNLPPTAPTNLGANSITTTSLGLTWNQSTDDQGIVFYRVFQDDQKISSEGWNKPAYPVENLRPDTAYKFVVEAVDSDGATARSAVFTVRTAKVPGPSPTFNYAIKGSTSLKTLVTGSMPLTGGIQGMIDSATGKFSADLILNPTNGRVVGNSWLPLTAKFGFVPVGKTTGVLEAATATKPQSLSTNSKVRIKVLRLNIFGAIPIVIGNSCQTKSLSDLNLKSTGAFDPLTGGTIAGTYAITDLNGCGTLTGLVSPLTAGDGNTISLTLTKQ